MTLINKKNILLTAVTCAISTNALSMEIGTFNDTTFSIGGYIKAEGVFNKPKNGDTTFDATAKQTRLNFKVQAPVEGHQVTGFLEGDFYGDGDGATNDYRLRHAWVKVDNLQVGQAWSGQLLATQYRELFDFINGSKGGVGAFNFRRTLVRYQTDSLNLTAQDPVFADASIPDTIATYKFPIDGGNVFKVSAMAREMENSDIGVGFAAAGKIMLGKNDIRLNAHYGEGLGKFTKVGDQGKLGISDSNDIDAAGNAVKQSGFNATYRHIFNDKLRANLAYTMADIDDTADTKFQSAHVNLIYNVLPKFEVGVEYRQFDLDSVTRTESQQVEVMAKYSF
ncbi:DcaP family trimeric outer membrane transporter [Amphritea sp. HPY]|uniref:DcaP family trimeric outer membrane transporter n=1 Tax=Amphritea sp. HPY TaxID=3421652 RepID=UPI003D7DD220